MELTGEDGQALNINSLFDDNNDGDEENSNSQDEKKGADFKKTIERLQAQGSDRLTYEAKSVVGKSARKASGVWSQYKQVILDGNPSSIWKCNNCPSLFTYKTSTGNTHMNRHKCHVRPAPSTENGSNDKQAIKNFLVKVKDVPQESIRQLNRDITIGLAKDLEPLYRSETEGFRYMAQKLISFGAKYGDQAIDKVIQHRTTLKRTHLPQICTEIQGTIRKSLTEAPSYPKFAFTKDMWTEKQKCTDFLSLSVHYIDPEWVLQKQLLGLNEFDAKKTTQNIRKECSGILKSYFEDPEMVIENSTSTTDGGSNMLKVFPKQLPCQCHKLNLFVDWTFNDRKLPSAEDIAKRNAKGKPFNPMKLFKLSSDCPQIKASISGIKELVTYFKQSHKNAQLPFTLKQDVSTRWNSQLIMLESYIKSINAVQKLLLETDSIKKLMFINETLVRELIDFLSPIRECSEVLSGDTYPTIQLVALWYQELQDHIQIKDGDSDEMQKLKQQAAYCFEKYLVVDDIHYAACILDPRYKSLQFADIERKTRAIDLLQQYIDQEKTETSPAPLSDNSIDTTQRQSRFQKFMDEHNSNETSELNRYLMMPSVPNAIADGEKFDILKFWKDSNDFPKMKQVAQWLLAIPASEATDERVFSDAGYVMKPRATSLNPDTLSHTVYLHRNVVLDN